MCVAIAVFAELLTRRLTSDHNDFQFAVGFGLAQLCPLRVQNNKKTVKMPRSQAKWFPEIPDDTYEKFTLEAQARGQPVGCICNRDNVKILCTGCHEIYHGRISRQCQAHPNVIFLHDFTKCAKCVMDPDAHLVELDKGLLDKILRK